MVENYELMRWKCGVTTAVGTIDSVRSCTVTHAGRDKPQSAHSSSCVHAHSGGTGNRYSLYPRTYCSTVALVDSASWKKSIFLRTLKVGANDRSAQDLQN